jgi:hypothetical protein
MPWFRRAAQEWRSPVGRAKAQRFVWKYANGRTEFQFLGCTGKFDSMGGPRRRITKFSSGPPNRRIRESQAAADQKRQIEAEAGRALDRSAGQRLVSVFSITIRPMGWDGVPTALILMADACSMFGSRMFPPRWFANGCVVC